MKTIKQIADEIGVTKDTIVKRISRPPLKERINVHMTRDEQGIRYIDTEGEKIIRRVYKIKEAAVRGTEDKAGDIEDLSEDKTKDTRNMSADMSGDTEDISGDKSANTGDLSGDTWNDSVHAAIEALTKQLEVKDKQIAALSEALLNAQKQGQAAQVLHAVDKQDLLSEDDPKTEPPRRKSLFDRLFKRS